ARNGTAAGSLRQPHGDILGEVASLETDARFAHAVDLFAVGMVEEAAPLLLELAAHARDGAEHALLEAPQRLPPAAPRVAHGLGVAHARALLQLALEGLAELPDAVATLDVRRLRQETQRLLDATASGAVPPRAVPGLYRVVEVASVAERAAEARAD